MMNSLEIFTPISKTDQIMSRYRRIAPKPQLPNNPNLEYPTQLEKTQQPSTKKLSATHLQTKPARSRKRNSTANPSSTHKKSKTHFSKTSPDAPCYPKDPQLGLSLQGFDHGSSGFSFTNPSFLQNPTRNCADLVTLSLLPYPCSIQAVNRSIPVNQSSMETILLPQIGENALNLHYMQEIPEEKDLLKKLQEPWYVSSDSGSGNLVTPQPLRPVGSSISVGCISENPSSTLPVPVCKKKPREVEEEIELDALPAVVSDSKNRVRLANAAYKKMVGQPECLWLDSTVNSDGKLRASTKRINGEVVLVLDDPTLPISSSNAFSCEVKIEWENNGQKIFIDAPCDVNRLCCDSKDYLFTWRFHTREDSDTNCENLIPA